MSETKKPRNRGRRKKARRHGRRRDRDESASPPSGSPPVGPAHGGQGRPLPKLFVPRGPAVCVVARGVDWVVVEKPAGFPAVPGRQPELKDSIQSRVREAFAEADGSLTCHRLDIETSGLMVLGLSRDAHRLLSRQFEHRKVGKRYVAVLDGEVEGEQGVVELPLILDWPNRPRQKVDLAEGKPARTAWTVLERHASTTRVAFEPLTGRTHQLRVHAATPREEGGLGCPILGDSLYGDPEKADRLHLHADSLRFHEPGTGVPREFGSPAPF